MNLEDMLQNGTVISETMIEKPHSFSTACNISTQIIAQIASSQYGGQSITLSHLAPFVQTSREKFRRMFAGNLNALERKQMRKPSIRLLKCGYAMKSFKRTDDPVSGNHTDDNQWTGSVCNCLYVSE